MRKIIYHLLLTLTFVGILAFNYADAQNVTVSGALVGNGSYATLGAAFTAINGGAQTGATISITIDNSTTEATVATLNSGAWTSLTITPNGGAKTITGSDTVTIKLAGADNVTIDGRIGGSGRNLTVLNTKTAVTSATAIWIAHGGFAASDSAGAQNIIIRNLEVACGVNQNTATTATFGINVGGTTKGLVSGRNNNSIQILENRVIRCRTAIAITGTSTNLNQNNSILRNIVGPTSFGADEIGITGINVQFQNNCNVSDNTVQFVGGDFANTTGGADRVGIGIGQSAWSSTATTTTTGSNYTVTNNIVHDIIEERTFSAVGIICATTLSGPATNNLVANNSIYNVRANGTSGDQGAGIGHIGNRGDRIVYNSISLTGDIDPGSSSSASTNPAMVGIAMHLGAAFDTAVTVNDNSVLLNLTSNTATLLKVCMQTNSTTYAWGSGGMNYNDYYIPPGDTTNHKIGLIGTGTTPTYGTLAIWKLVYTPAQDANSISSDPLYTSNTSNLQPGIGSPLVAAGTPITGVTTDLLGVTRNVTTPTIGAYENAADLAGPSILYSLLSNTTSTSNRSFTPVTITDPSGVNGTSGTSPRVYYKKSTDPNTSAGWKYTEATGSSPFSFTIDNSLIGGVSTGDNIQYFVVAQDLASTPNVSINSGTFAAQPSSVALTAAAFPITGTINNYYIVGAPLAGDYTIGVALFNSITGRNITFDRVVTKVMKEVYEPEITDGRDKSVVQDATSLTSTPMRKVMKEVEEVSYVPMSNGSRYNGPLYVSRKEYPNLPSDAGVGIYATITAAVTDLNLRGVSAAVRFLLLDANYTSSTETYPITINPITGGSAANTVTIRPQAGVTTTVSGTNANGVFKLFGADYVTIDGSNSGGTDRNMTIIDSNSAGIGIWVGSASASDGAMFNTIKNCNISGLSSITTIAGIISGSGTTLGNDAESPNSNLTVNNNFITNMQNAAYLRGNTTTYDTGVVVYGNTFGTSSANLGFRGMLIGNSKNFRIYANTISGVISSSSSSATMQGIQVALNVDGGNIYKNSISNIKQINTTGWGSAGILLGAATTASNVSVYNNFISDVASYGYAGTLSSDNGYGMMVDLGGGYKIYYNSVWMNTNQTLTTGLPAALNVSSSITTAGSLSIRNNILSNTQTAGTNRYCVYSAAAATVYATINYNDYYFASNPNLGYLGGNQATLGNWQTATGRDTSSISGDPIFISSTNLHIDSSLSSPCNAAAAPVAGILDDIDGNLRSGSTPDIGADEFNVNGAPTNNVGVQAILNPLAGVNSLSGPSIIPSATIRNFGTANQTSPFNTTCTISPGGYSSTVADTLSAGLSRNLSFSSFSPTVGVVYTVTVYTSLVGDINTSNDTLKQTSSFIAANYGSDTGYFYANTLATDQSSYPKYCWKDTTGSKNLVLNTVQSGGTTLVGTLDDGYFKLSLRDILLSMNQDTTNKHIKYNGNCYDSIFPGTNGIVGLTEQYGATSLSTFTVSATSVANNALLPLWKDMDLRYLGIGASSNRLCYRVSGNQLIITYNNVGTYNSAASSPDWTSYQIVMEIVNGCGSGNSNFRYTYADTTTGQASGSFVSKYLSSYNGVPPATTTFGNFIVGYSKTGAPMSYNGYVSGGPLSVKRPIYSLTTNLGLAVEFGPVQSSLNEHDCLTFKLYVALEGLQNNTSPGPRARDTVTVYVRDGNTPPFNVVQQFKVLLDSVVSGPKKYGRAIMQISMLKRGNPYYIVVQHRNSVSTWSNLTSTSADTLTYDFTSSIGQAYGSNSVMINGVAACFTGDVTQDGIDDGSDGALIDNDASNFESGDYLKTDLNWDGIVDGSDGALLDNNAANFIGEIKPPGALNISSMPNNYDYKAPVEIINIPDRYMIGKDKK